MWERLVAVWSTGWDLHPELAIGIGILLLAFVGRLAEERTAGRAVPVGRVSLFLQGVTTLYVTLGSPLHHLSDEYLFSAHMLQHLLLTLVVPPLLLLGTPNWLVHRIADRPWVKRLARTPQFAMVSFAIFNLLFVFIHVPAVYDALFGSDLPHRATHLLLLGTAAIMWLPLVSPVPDLIPRLSLPAQMLYAFAQVLPGQMVGGLLSFSDRVIYQKYGAAAEAFGLTPLMDQQIGALLMWVIGGFFWLLVLTIIFFVWADRVEAHAYG
ncbi:MAG: hypothetical protein GEU73_10035 [Chloroflexi bacterium]|nr:hypothetical protein [Chloroflexota bacterium]